MSIAQAKTSLSSTGASAIQRILHRSPESLLFQVSRIPLCERKRMANFLAGQTVKSMHCPSSSVASFCWRVATLQYTTDILILVLCGRNFLVIDMLRWLQQLARKMLAIIECFTQYFQSFCLQVVEILVLILK